MARLCKAVRPDGGGCKKRSGGTEYCFIHDPARRSAREQAYAKAAAAAREHVARRRGRAAMS